METALQPKIDIEDLRTKVRSMYTQVALEPEAGFHFELGPELAIRLGYPVDELSCLPAAAVRSFAGVGHHFDLANIQTGECVLDLGSGSGMDVFLASQKAGSTGSVTGIDMTDAQLENARSLAEANGISNVSFIRAYLEDLPMPNESIDVVISNGVINLCADKMQVFREIARVLPSGGRLAFSDILTERQLTESIVCDTSLWASCIGGATQKDLLQDYLQSAGFDVVEFRENPEYQFLSRSAKGAAGDFGVMSASILAVRR